MKIIRLKPTYDERVWGGSIFKSALGRSIPPDILVGESREICDRPEMSSSIVGGAFDGLTLREAIERDSKYIMGPKWNAQRRFPLIVKWLDCQQRLSLQVHPSAKSEKLVGGERKSEAWYFLRATPFSKYVAGVKYGVDARKIMRDIKRSALDKCLIFHNSAAGDFVEIRGGCMHSLGSGNLVLEVQENSATTYRVYDWNRIGLDGKPRELQVEKALACTDFDTPAPVPTHENFEEIRELCSLTPFSMTRRTLKSADTWKVCAFVQPRIISVLKGSLADPCGDRIGEYENVILPYGESFDFRPEGGGCEFISTENFAL